MSLYRLWRLQRPHVTTPPSSSRPYRLPHPTTSPSTWQLWQCLCHMSYYRPRNGNDGGNGNPTYRARAILMGLQGPLAYGAVGYPRRQATPPCTAFLEPIWVRVTDLCNNNARARTRPHPRARMGMGARARTRTHAPAPARLRTRARAWAAWGLESVPLSLFPPRKIWFLGSGYIYTI
jgi:hypothetical protein